MPFSRMFDPSGVIYKELEECKIDCVACLAHREVFFLSFFFSLTTLHQELDYHTNKRLLQYYSDRGIVIHLYEVDDMCTPADPDEFSRFATAILDVCLNLVLYYCNSLSSSLCHPFSSSDLAIVSVCTAIQVLVGQVSLLHVSGSLFVSLLFFSFFFNPFPKLSLIRPSILAYTQISKRDS